MVPYAIPYFHPIPLNKQNRLYRRIKMEADRVHSYLKIACSALGFEVGEVWITANEIVKHENTGTFYFRNHFPLTHF